MVEKLNESGSPASFSVPSSEILAKIIDKERELELSLLDAQDEANRIIQVAKEKASSITARHRKESEAEAAAIKEEIIRNARQEAERVKASLAQKIKAVKEIPEGRLNKAVDQLLKRVLPSGEV